MRLSAPRIAPLPETEWTPETREVIGAGTRKPLNIFTTLARHPKLLKRWSVFGNHVLAKSSLPARERELLILRTGHRCQSAYEFHQHTRIGLAAGLTQAEIEQLRAPAPVLHGRDVALVRAADELHDDQMISDATWQALRADWNEQQLMDIVFAVGQYTLVSMALNTFGVQIERGSEGGER